MALFQTSVLKNYLKRQDAEPVAKAYKKFSKYFHNPSIQQNIRDSKEEQFQEGFLRELFVGILGYTLNPQPNFNLTTELKNEKGAKKADGAILLDGNALGVIELKSTKTKDLESIRQQAFDYKANQTGCVYVVTSNFEKLRFYINNAVEFEEFDLFTLTQNQFELLYLCLHKDNLLGNVPLKIKEASVREEEVITKKFYNDYSLFKRELFRDLVKLNMKNEVFRSEFNREDTERANKNIKHNLFKKSQKLIDRFLFIFFAEDRDLLPPNSTLKILDQWNKLKDLDAYTPLYDRFKLYFGYLDTGRKGTEKGAEIFAYNGGLFKPDTILDSLKISDELLFKHTEALSKYDFESQVDVNILGHIFENSLNEIESVNAEIEGVEFDKQKTKRKKDGVFYTPKYITKYIVDNTVGKLCEEKKAELNIVDEEYTKNRKGRTTAKLKELKDQLENYRNWLLQITICDPACGSGAFLNQALDFLIKEHQYIDELQTSLLGGGFVFPDIENTVLENNIFGVDLNEESVEIAKLSLWLRTAQPKRKLNDLSSNIKCGNSLIDDPKVAGNKAFKWEKEFPQIFAKGGFDVVIGNPPYVQIFEHQDYYDKNYYTSNCGDLYALFYEKGIHILKEKGFFSYITPSLFIKGIRYENLRFFLLNNTTLIEIDDKGDGVFQDVQMPTAIVVAIKNKVKNQDWNKYIPGGNLINKIEDNSILLSSISKIKRGLEIGKDKVFDFDLNQVKILTGEDVSRYQIKQYQSISSETFEEYKKDEEFFNGERLIIRETGNRITSLYVNENVQQNRSLYTILLEDENVRYKYILGIINSSLIQFYYKSKFAANTDVFPKIRIAQVKDLPIKIVNETLQFDIEVKVDSILNNSLLLKNSTSNFTQLLQSKFNIEKLTTKLQSWHELEFKDFLKELKKAKVQLSLSEEAEWMQYFNEQKQKAQALKSEINRVDAEIDKMVYQLYGLNEEEIKIVEGEV
ncbi:MAG: N-6 DNA methylase [Flavobacteriales bacterium]|nr:N-6 DNA methylase [Flavobacteriales bacterium]MCB9365084.1 N-6 DNA methylase [Flavobacteriales bacterium]